MRDGEGAASDDAIAVEIRIGDEALARRIADWLDRSDIFIRGLSSGARTVLIADHIPDDVSAPVVLLADEGAGAVWPTETRVAARLPSTAAPAKIRIAVEAAAHGLSVAEFDPPRLSGEAVDLTPRERQVLRFIAEGASNKLIARELDISAHTVKFHVAGILQKLDAASRTEAVTHAVRLGLLMV